MKAAEIRGVEPVSTRNCVQSQPRIHLFSDKELTAVVTETNIQGCPNLNHSRDKGIAEMLPRSNPNSTIRFAGKKVYCQKNRTAMLFMANCPNILISDSLTATASKDKRSS
jgi:hypothetical protein